MQLQSAKSNVSRTHRGHLWHLEYDNNKRVDLGQPWPLPAGTSSTHLKQDRRENLQKTLIMESFTLQQSFTRRVLTCEWNVWLYRFSVCVKFHFIPALAGLKKEGAMTAIPPAPISAAWWAWRRHEDCAANTEGFYQEPRWGQLKPSLGTGARLH